MTQLEQFKQIMAQLLQCTLDQLDLDQRLDTLSAWDSLIALRVLSYLEQNFHCKIPLPRFLQAKQVGDIYDLIAKEGVSCPK
jgi:acyl carrier protein